MTVRILLVDDHDLVRRGVRVVLEGENDLSVVAEAASVEEARRVAIPVDVAVMDVRLCDGNGVELSRWLSANRPLAARVLLTSLDEDRAILAALLAGASGCVLKQVKGLDLISVVREAASGESSIGGTEIDVALSRQRAIIERASVVAGCDENAMAVLRLLGMGLADKEIARELGVDPSTVDAFVRAMVTEIGLGPLR